jgi:DNA-binding LacI/PurR family transcriptional regulator
LASLSIYAIVGTDGTAPTGTVTLLFTDIEGSTKPIDEIAETAVNALSSLIADPQKPLPDYSFRPQLSVRGSTARPSSTPR